MPDAAARIGVERLDERGDGLTPVTHDLGRRPFGDRDHGAIDHQDPVVPPVELFLDDHPPSVDPSLLETPGNLLRRCQPDGHPAPVVSVQRLGHHWPADLRGLRHRFGGGAHHRPSRRRHASGGQEGLGQVLVASGFHSDQRGVAGNGGPEDFLSAAPTEAKQALVVEPGDRDVAALRLANERRCRRPERVTTDKGFQRRQFGLEVKGRLASLDPRNALQVLRQQAVH